MLLLVNLFYVERQSFLARMIKDGRSYSKLVLTLLKNGKSTLEGYVMEVMLYLS